MKKQTKLKNFSPAVKEEIWVRDRGIARNGALGCRDHHNMLDNGNKGRYAEMHAMFREYLSNHYVDWNEKELVYSKWT